MQQRTDESSTVLFRCFDVALFRGRDTYTRRINTLKNHRQGSHAHDLELLENVFKGEFDKDKKRPLESKNYLYMTVRFVRKGCSFGHLFDHRANHVGQFIGLRLCRRFGVHADDVLRSRRPSNGQSCLGSDRFLLSAYRTNDRPDGYFETSSSMQSCRCAGATQRRSASVV